MRFCKNCGFEGSHADANNCEACGHLPQTESRQWALGLPTELWAVIGCLVVAGVLVAFPALQALPDTLKLVSAGSEFLGFGLLALVLLITLMFLGAACIGLAVLLYRGDPVGRFLSIVSATSLAVGLALADGREQYGTLIMLASLAIVAVLWLAPNVRRYFSEQPSQPQPAPIVAARAIVVVLAGILGLNGLTFLPIGSLEVKVRLIGLLLVAIAVWSYKLSVRLGTGDPTVRAIVSVLMGGYVVAILLAGRRDPALLVPLGLSLAVVGLLWIPSDSERHFLVPSARTPLWVQRLTEAIGNGKEAVNRLSASSPPTWRADVQSVSADGSSFSRGPAESGQPRLPRVELLTRERLTAADELVSTRLGVQYNRRTWFPCLPASETSGEKWVVMIETKADRSRNSISSTDSPDTRDVEVSGKSTLLVTTTRILGACAQGRCLLGPLGPLEGPVAVWDFSFDGVSSVTHMAAEAQEGESIALTALWHSEPTLYIRSPRKLVDGKLRVVNLEELIDAISGVFERKEDDLWT